MTSFLWGWWRRGERKRRALMGSLSSRLEQIGQEAAPDALGSIAIATVGVIVVVVMLLFAVRLWFTYEMHLAHHTHDVAESKSFWKNMCSSADQLQSALKLNAQARTQCDEAQHMINSDPYKYALSLTAEEWTSPWTLSLGLAFCVAVMYFFVTSTTSGSGVSRQRRRDDVDLLKKVS